MSIKVFYPSDTYSFGDLNRVSANIKNLENRIRALEYPLPPTSNLHVWSIMDLGLIDRINILRERIINIYKYFFRPPGAPALEVDNNPIQVFDFSDANDLELALYLIGRLVNSLLDNYKYCGTFTTGEVDVI